MGRRIEHAAHSDWRDKVQTTRFDSFLRLREYTMNGLV